MSLGKQVDVWSAGILFYQMLFGRRPFGHDQTQERILREDTIIKARKVEFPSRPAVSNEAKVSYAHGLMIVSYSIFDRGCLHSRVVGRRTYHSAWEKRNMLNHVAIDLCHAPLTWNYQINMGELMELCLTMRFIVQSVP